MLDPFYRKSGTVCGERFSKVRAKIEEIQNQAESTGVIMTSEFHTILQVNQVAVLGLS